MSARWKLALRGAIVVGALNLAFGTVYAFCRACRPALFVEDGVTEWATAVMFLAAAVIGAVRLGLDRWQPRVLVAAPVLALVAATDELSLSVRWFEMDAPRISGTRIDGVHDLVEAGFRTAQAHPWAVLPVVPGLALALLYVASRRIVREKLRVFLAQPGLLLAWAAVGCVTMAQVIDLGIVETTRHLQFLEELFELDAAVLWCMFCATLTAADAAQPSPIPVHQPIVKRALSSERAWKCSVPSGSRQRNASMQNGPK